MPEATTHSEAEGGALLGAPAPTEAELVKLDRRLDERVLGRLSMITGRYMLVALLLALLVAAGLFAWGWQIYHGIGVSGKRRPAFWGFYITSFVFWIGISHSGTLISAILRVLKVEWRRPLTRGAELMTVFALMIGALFPIVHLGRPWRFYWLIPYPNERNLWPNFHSALLWDMLAILTYLTTSILFLYLPLIPDLAAARDRSRGLRRRVYSVLSLGWRGSQQQWHRLELGMKIFTIVVIPVAVSVHSIVSWDFAMTLVPNWNSTVFAPYFVLGAIYSGTAALITVLIVVRKALGLTEYITVRHIDRLGKVLLAVSVLWFYFFWADFFTNWYARHPVQQEVEHLHVWGQLAPLFWGMLLFCIGIPLAMLWFRRIRTSMAAMLVIAVLINVGMWIERFLIVNSSLWRNDLSFEWGSYFPGWPEIVIAAATFGAFGFFYVVASKGLPLLSLWEVKYGWRLERWRREGLADEESEIPRAAVRPELGGRA